MRIKKIYNNNVLLAENDKHVEKVVMGRGIAFKKRADEEVDTSKIEKTFILEKNEWSRTFEQLLNEIPAGYFEIADEIIRYAQSALGAQFSKYIYLTLTDHISFALRRHREHIDMRNALIWEIKKFYKDEFAAGVTALDIIKRRTGEQLPEDEAGFIALHFVNAQIEGQRMQQTMEMTGITNDILNIVKYYFHTELDENSLNYERFVTHLRFFNQRLFHREQIQSDGDDFLHEQVKKKYPDAYSCTNRIKAYFKRSFDFDISIDEQIYLTIHIHRVTDRRKRLESKT
ncbi:BglG family transcription antiterminator LicT [Sporolactobacillus sp. Y61]|uniref:BglG family transcription antiterminator LicT n=1 Tax=Sporolactobacillus sp. Y61 TaxID=3160863 RepID=A0AAU8IJ74_9BACL